ncbi:aminomethyltransferase family protein [Paenarthrobacter sp. RAF54_2]|uniref:aminomethyltransferase family protein n=1 Tax=Paenarthrobacter sp. RAF54_2 TaxID=3233061 RepID=UPI003F972BB8
MQIPPGLEPNPTTSRFAHRVSEWADSFGRPFAIDYGDPAKEYKALREAVVALEYSTIRKWYVEGPDAVAAVDRVFSRNVRALRVGTIVYGVFTDDDGFMIEDTTLVKLSPETVLVLGGEQLTQQQLERALPKGTTVTDRRGEFAAVSLQGPLSRTLLQRLTKADISNEALPYYGSLIGVEVANVPATILRLGFTAELGFEIIVPVEHADTLWDEILAQHDLGIELMGLEAILVARTEAGMVMNNYEYDRSTTPYECGLGWTIDFEKGQFQGRDALLTKKKDVPTRLVSIETTADAACLDGRPVLLNGMSVGRISMAVASPVLGGRTVALARVDSALARIGSALEVGTDSGAAPATVRRTPVYDPERLRVRS